jgi:hypothetical protein
MYGMIERWGSPFETIGHGMRATGATPASSVSRFRDDGKGFGEVAQGGVTRFVIRRKGSSTSPHPCRVNFSQSLCLC